jgi:hypothetical protein
MHPADDNAITTEEKIWSGYLLRQILIDSHRNIRDLTMTINVKGVWWGCKYAILAMRKNPVSCSFIISEAQEALLRWTLFVDR